MANSRYVKANESFMKGEFNLLSDTIKPLLVNTLLYARNRLTDQFLSDIPSGARVAMGPALTGKSVTGGVLSADPVTFTTPTGADCALLVLLQDTGTPTTSRLIEATDLAGGLPITLDGTNVIVYWDSGTGKIFVL